MKKPNYKRQKALLALLDIFNGELSKTDLQKYMFLYVKEFSQNEHYAFVPYHYVYNKYPYYAIKSKISYQFIYSIIVLNNEPNLKRKPKCKVEK